MKVASVFNVTDLNAQLILFIPLITVEQCVI
jgi:hypothetical protein